MRKLFLLLVIITLTVCATSCTTMRKDCQGNRHYKLKNGIYL